MSNLTNQNGRLFLAACLILITGSSSVSAQQQAGYHQPFSQHSPPGQLAGVLNAARHYDPSWMQPLNVDVAGGADVEIYQGSAPVPAGTSPAMVSCAAGYLYRLKISNLPSSPGTELFPTVELLDRLHPPEGRELEFAIPIVITEADLSRAVRGNLVTRIIYLEQPQLAQQIDPLKREVPQAVLPTTNAVEEADRLGRPMAIIRIGGRRLSANASPAFFGNGGPVQIPQSVEEQAARAAHSARQTKIQQVSGVGFASISQFCPAPARVACEHHVPASDCQACSPGTFGGGHPIQPQMPCTACSSPYSQAYPDEYICDGGDRDHPIHYPGGVREGLDTEDTIAEFDDHEGESHYRVSNRVCVYAPRFGAVETVTGPGIDVKVDRAAGAREIRGSSALLDHRGQQTSVANTPATGLRTREGASGVEMSQSPFQNRRAQNIVQSSKVDQGFLNTMIQGPNLLAMTDMLQTSVKILTPVSSNQDTLLGIAESTIQATQTFAMYKVQSMLGTDKSARKGDLRITKRASTSVAKAGETITFTLQFRNIGDRPVSNVRIVDNLTPRLVYVTGSAEINVPDGTSGTLSVLPNKEGSEILEFTLDAPLAGQTTGTITFQTKVL